MANKEEKLIFGQVVVGPPGSGKTTYCLNIYNYLKKLGRKVMIVNLDPGIDVSLPFSPSINIKSLISLEETMSQHNLGPNGALIYCMEYLELNLDWLIEKIDMICFTKNENENISDQSTDQTNGQNVNKYPYLIFDSPGQIELYVHHNSLKNVIQKITNSKIAGFDLRLTAVNLVDSYYTNDPGKFIAALLNSLFTMLLFELPHINVLSKMDLIEKFSSTHFNYDYYCDVLDLNYLVDRIIDDPFMNRYKKLSQTIANIVEDYSLVKFVPLDVNQPQTLIELMKLVDKANGYFLVHFDNEG